MRPPSVSPKRSQQELGPSMAPVGWQGPTEGEFDLQLAEGVQLKEVHMLYIGVALVLRNAWLPTSMRWQQASRDLGYLEVSVHHGYKSHSICAKPPRRLPNKLHIEGVADVCASA